MDEFEKDFSLNDTDNTGTAPDVSDADDAPMDISFANEKISDNINVPESIPDDVLPETIDRYAEEEAPEELEAEEAEEEILENEVSEDQENDVDLPVTDDEYADEEYDEPEEFDEDPVSSPVIDQPSMLIPRKPSKTKRNSKKRRNTIRTKGSRSKKKKKKGLGFNNSIFGGLIIVTIILTVSLVLAITGIKIGFEYLGAGKSSENITFNIPENSTPEQIADILIDNNIIENKTLFKIAMKMQHSPTLFPGDVTLNPAMGYAKVIETLSTQRDIRETVTITFPEGITLLEAANLLQEKKVCEKTEDFIFEFNKLQDFSFETMIDKNADTYYKMEGFFFPDTYEFYVGDEGYNVTRIIRSNFSSKVDSNLLQQMKNKNMTLSQVITLASMVQWEANSVEDMPKVASVFLNRLAKPDEFPRLQSDATANYLKKVINVVGDTASKDHYSDLYDTYKCEGLPVGPVCNPGLDAIRAVLYPEETNYYYFCNNLETGKSYFAETYEEHQKNLIRAGLA